MVRDGETHAEEDKKKKETINAKNNLDNMVYQSEKMLNENKDLPDSDKKKLEDAVAAAKTTLQNSGQDLSALKSATDALTAATHAISQALYEKQKQSGAGAPPPPGAGPSEGASSAGKDDVIDADFKDVK